MLHIRTAALIAAASLLGAAQAQAAVVKIPGLYNTGVDDAGDALAGGNGVADTHYRILSFSPGVPTQAVTFHDPAYPADDADSRWIAQHADGSDDEFSTIYRLTFDLTGLDWKHARLSGFAEVDNFMDIELNDYEGTVLVFGYAKPTPFTFDSVGFRPGLNTLTFRVSSGDNPIQAFRVDGLEGAARDGVPEPAAWALMIAGFAGVGAALRRRRSAPETVPQTALA